MTATKAALLPDRGVIKLTGPDTEKFLQGLITNDMENLSGKQALHAGLLTPQGKILFEFFVVEADSAVFLEVERAQITALIEHLNKYILRANVKIEDVSARYTVAAIWNGEDLPDPNFTKTISYADPRLSALGLRVLLTLETDDLPAELDCQPAASTDYDAHRIALGVPQGGKDYALADTFPHEALFDQLNGVSFTKGCYIGQEVVSRMQHRATARKRIVPINAESELPAVGTAIRTETTSLGVLGTNAGPIGLGLLRLDRASQAMAAGEKLFAGETPITIKIPSWANFALEPNQKDEEA